MFTRAVLELGHPLHSKPSGATSFVMFMLVVPRMPLNTVHQTLMCT
jgi:hypothetical protein